MSLTSCMSESEDSEIGGKIQHNLGAGEETGERDVFSPNEADACNWHGYCHDAEAIFPTRFYLEKEFVGVVIAGAGRAGETEQNV